MHVLIVAPSFPSPEYPHRASFLGTQVRLLSELVDRITVVSPTTYVPRFLGRIPRLAVQSRLPKKYYIAGRRCVVLFPRYVKAPGTVLSRWTVAQWRRIVDHMVASFQTREPISLIHANGGQIAGWSAICTGKKYGIPSVVTYQGSEVNGTLAKKQDGWELCRDSFRYANLNLPVSIALESVLRQYAEPIGRCEVLYRGTDPNCFFPNPKLTRTENVVFVGHIRERKGIFELLRAWSKTKRSCPDASLTFIGEDHTQGAFLAHARSLGIGDSVSWAGPVSPSNVAEVMRNARLLCLPSHSEGMPNCVMEAMACGLPVVATGVGGIPEVVRHGVTGLLVKPGDTDGLSAALITLLRDYQCSARMGEAARSFAEGRLDARKTARRIVALYRELTTSFNKSLSQMNGVSANPADIRITNCRAR